ncbi:MAG: NUDIX hydrolase [Planctomycetota bacterium]|nr:MAG: NUDIX hydrolase [Planctomycetota bacterium]
MSSDENKYLKSYNIKDYDIPLATVDMSIFSIIDGTLNVLLIHRDTHPEKGKLSLPGGFINLKEDQNLDETAHRKLFEKTGLKSPYLEQVETTGNATRDPRGWSVTILYFALLDFGKVKEKALKDSKWFPVNKAKKEKLAFDHNELLEKAFDRLKSRTSYTALPMALMPNLFTLTELQTVFEIILEKKLPIKSFRRRILTAEVVIPTGESKLSGKRNAQLFKSKGVSKDFYFQRPLQV